MKRIKKTNSVYRIAEENYRVKKKNFMVQVKYELSLGTYIFFFVLLALYFFLVPDLHVYICLFYFEKVSSILSSKNRCPFKMFIYCCILLPENMLKNTQISKILANVYCKACSRWHCRKMHKIIVFIKMEIYYISKPFCLIILNNSLTNFQVNLYTGYRFDLI